MRTRDGERRAAVEVMIGAPTIGDLIRRNEVAELKGIMEKLAEAGMQTYDGALFKLVVEGAIRGAPSIFSCCWFMTSP